MYPFRKRIINRVQAELKKDQKYSHPMAYKKRREKHIIDLMKKQEKWDNGENDAGFVN